MMHDATLSNWRDHTITVLDFEGTGVVKGWPDEPWQIGLVQIRGGSIIQQSAYESLLRIGDRPFNRHAPGRHEELRCAMRSAPDLPSLWPVLKTFLEGTVLAAHQASTEKRYLSHAFPLHAPDITLDTLKLTRKVYPGLTSYRLDDLLKRLSLQSRVHQMVPEREPHDALYDAVGCAVLLEHLLSQPGWSSISLEALSQIQMKRHRSSRRHV